MKPILISIFILFSFQSRAQIKSVVVGGAAYLCTSTTENIVFLKRNDKYFAYVKCDGGKDTTKTKSKIVFEGAQFVTESPIKVNQDKYLLTYEYSILFDMPQELINLFLNQKVLSLEVGGGTRYLNTGKFKLILKELIEYKN